MQPKQAALPQMDSSFDNPDYDYAASIAGRAMRSMAEQRFAPTPANFAVWYQYFAGGHDDLRNAIDLLIDHHRPFDARTNQNLFETYVAPQVSALVVDTSERLQALCDDLVIVDERHANRVHAHTVGVRSSPVGVKTDQSVPRSVEGMLSTPSERDHATVRELIVQLAEVEDALRHAGGSGLAGSAELAEREQEIVAALHEHGLPFHAQGADRT